MVNGAGQRLSVVLCHIGRQVVHELVVDPLFPLLWFHFFQVGSCVLSLRVSRHSGGSGRRTATQARHVIIHTSFLGAGTISHHHLSIVPLLDNLLTFLASELMQLVRLVLLEFEFAHNLIPFVVAIVIHHD